MNTALDNVLIAWSQVCKDWQELAVGFVPQLGAFLSGWYWRDMGNILPNTKDIGEFRDSFRRGWIECDHYIARNKK